MKKSLGIAIAVLGLAFGGQLALAAPGPLAITDAGATLSGDPEKGAVVFKKCQVCHSITEGKNLIGPSLHGVVGRTAGSVPGFNYSTANKSSGIVWTEQKIFDYLLKPQAMVPGTKMSFPGLPSAQDRADLISYLKQNSP